VNCFEIKAADMCTVLQPATESEHFPEVCHWRAVRSCWHVCLLPWLYVSH